MEVSRWPGSAHAQADRARRTSWLSAIRQPAFRAAPRPPKTPAALRRARTPLGHSRNTRARSPGAELFAEELVVNPCGLERGGEGFAAEVFEPAGGLRADVDDRYDRMQLQQPHEFGEFVVRVADGVDFARCGHKSFLDARFWRGARRNASSGAGEFSEMSVVRGQ
jgi:hypothetical protein